MRQSSAFWHLCSVMGAVLSMTACEGTLVTFKGRQEVGGVTWREAELEDGD